VILNISKKDLKEYYLKQRLSSRRIAKIYNCAYSTIDRKIRLYGLRIRNRAEAHIIYPKKDFNGSLSEKGTRFKTS